MKKFLVFAGALCAIALFLVYCDNPTLDNPIDERGDNCVACEKAKDFDEDLNYVLDNWYTEEGKKWDCDSKKPWVEVVPPHSVLLNWKSNDDKSRFAKFMTTETDVITYGDGQILPARPELVSSQRPDEPAITNYPGYPNIPEHKDTTIYVIRYKVTKQFDEACRAFVKPGDEDDYAYRVIRIYEAFEGVDTRQPEIIINGNNPDVITRRDDGTYSDPGAYVLPNGNIKNITGSVNVSDTGTYTIEYEGCRTLVYSETEDEEVCVKATRTVRVTGGGPVPSAQPIIVLKTYRINAGSIGTFNLRDTTYRQGTSFTFTEPGGGSPAGGAFNPSDAVKEVYYIDTKPDGTREKVVVNDLIPNVKRGNVQTPTTNDRGRTVNYTLDAQGIYQNASTSRQMFMQDSENACFGEYDLLSIGPSSALPINAREYWDGFGSGWWVVSELGLEHRLGTDFGSGNSALDHTFPLPGTYEVTHVGVGICGEYKKLERTVTVQ